MTSSSSFRSTIQNTDYQKAEDESEQSSLSTSPESPELPQATTDPNLRRIVPTEGMYLNLQFKRLKGLLSPEHRYNKACTCNLPSSGQDEGRCEVENQIGRDKFLSIVNDLLLMCKSAER
jgi:hypothetical protein